VNNYLPLHKGNVKLSSPCEYVIYKVLVIKVLVIHQMIIQITSRCRRVLRRDICIEINFLIKIPFQGYGTQGFVSGYFDAVCM